MDPFDKLSEDVGALFRPQRQWGEGQGLYLIWAFFFSGVGAGTWLVSTPLLFDVRLGLVAGFLLLVGASGGAHLAFLGRPLRFWRIVVHVRTSWLSRGMLGMLIFSVSGLLYLLPMFAAGVPWSMASHFGEAMLVVSVLSALWITTYKGFVFGAARGIPFWNSPILPPVFIGYAFRSGLAILLLIAAAGGKVAGLHAVETTKLWTVVSAAAIVLFYVWIMKDSGVAAQRSVQELLRGRISLPFYLGVVLAGILIPVAGGSLAFFTELPRSAVGAIAVASLIGDFYITYAIAKAGIYAPLTFGAFPRASGLEAI
jgi:formate-dependent nitrite reductase membrane component NrfD